MMIPFSPPRIDEAIIDEVVDTLKSGWITTGPKTKRFEKEISNYLNVSNTICVNSATAGMELMLRWFGVGEGDEVILPAYTYCATANVVMHCGARPVMIDSDEDFNITAKTIEKHLTERTKVIMPVDIGGFPVDLMPIMELVKRQSALFKPKTNEQQQLGRVLVLSDAAHAFGASYEGKKVGSLADISVYSFHAVKNLSTAEGGAVAINLPPPFNCEAIYKDLCVSVLHGQSKDAMSKLKPGSWRYDVVEPGYKCNMTDIQAAIGLVELARYEQETLPKRKALSERYHQAFSEEPWYIAPPLKTQQSESSYHLFMLRINGIDETLRDQIITEISEQEVAVNVHFQPLPMLSVYKNLGYQITDFPQAYKHYATEISLPLFYDLTNEQQDWVIDCVKKAINKRC